MNRRSLGGDREKYAADYLKGLGYEILSMNFYCSFGEIDIVARDKGEMVFAEVKYRSSLRSGLPEEAVNIKKQGRIYKSAVYYMYKNHISESAPCRFDVIALEGNVVRHYKNAFGGMA